MTYKSQFITAIISFLFSVCLSTSSIADEEDYGHVATARNGARVWANSCAHCHNLRRTDEFTDQQWIPIVSHMRIRAGLTGDEAADIIAFLQASNSRN